MEGSGSGEEPVSLAPIGGQIPHKLSTTSSTGGPTQEGGSIPHKLTSKLDIVKFSLGGGRGVREALMLLKDKKNKTIYI